MMMTMSIWIQRQSVRLCHWNVGHLEWNGMEWDIDTSVVLFELDITRAWTPSFNRRSFVQQDAPPSRRNGWTLQLCMFHNKRRRRDEGDVTLRAMQFACFINPRLTPSLLQSERDCVFLTRFWPPPAPAYGPVVLALIHNSYALLSCALTTSCWRIKRRRIFILIGRAAAVDAMAISIRIVL